MKDLIIGAFSNHSWRAIQYWVNSIDRCGFTGDRAAVVYNCDKATLDQLRARQFDVHVFEPDAIVNGFSYSYPFHIWVHRFYALFEYLNNLRDIDQYRYVIATDVRDVVFQTSPSKWLEKHMGDKKICASSENLRYRDEPWGKDSMAGSFPLLYDRMLDRPIWNCGVQAGEIRTMRDFWLQLNMIAAAGHHVADQAAYNIMLSLRPWSSMTRFTGPEDAWACQLGAAVDKFTPYTMEKGPTWDGPDVTTATGKKYAIVHQYDRFPALRQSVHDWYKPPTDALGEFAITAADFRSSLRSPGGSSGGTEHLSVIEYRSGSNAGSVSVLFFGPYIHIEPGTYLITFEGDLDGALTIEIAHTTGATMTALTLSDFSHPIALAITEPLDNFEIRGIRTPSLQHLRLVSVSVVRIAQPGVAVTRSAS